jgi:hypothetical protein
MLNRSMLIDQSVQPSVSAPPRSGQRKQIRQLNPLRDQERHLHLSEEVYQTRSGFPRDICTSDHSWRRVITFHPKV